LEIQNGNIKINKILASTETISANVSETPIEIGVETDMFYAIHGEVSNGNFEHPEHEKLRLFRDGKVLSFNGEIGEKNTNLTSIVLFSINGNIKIINN
jgi:hypothetical protein